MDKNDEKKPTTSGSQKPFADGIEKSLLPKAKDSNLARKDSLFTAIGNYYESQRGKRR